MQQHNIEYIIKKLHKAHHFLTNKDKEKIYKCITDILKRKDKERQLTIPKITKTHPCLEKLLDLVCISLNIEKRYVISPTQNSDATFVRHIFFYLARKIEEKYNKGYSLSDIAYVAGRKNHATVIHGYKNIVRDIKIYKKKSHIVNVVNKIMFIFEHVYLKD